jgi:hypothetical protein
MAGRQLGPGNRQTAYVGLIMLLALQPLQPMPLKHDLGSRRSKDDQVQ